MVYFGERHAKQTPAGTAKEPSVLDVSKGQDARLVEDLKLVSSQICNIIDADLDDDLVAGTHVLNFGADANDRDMGTSDTTIRSTSIATEANDLSADFVGRTWD